MGSQRMDPKREYKLIQEAAAGDRDAAAALVRAHQVSLYTYIFRLCGRPELAEDVVQEAFVRAITHLGRFDPKYRFSTWLFTIARRVYLNMIEKKRPASDSDRVAETAGRSCATNSAWEDREHTRASCDAVQDALLALPPDQREIMILFHQHEWPIWLIAEHLGKPEGTVKSHLHRGRVRLREIMRAKHPALLGIDEAPAPAPSSEEARA